MTREEFFASLEKLDTRFVPRLGATGLIRLHNLASPFKIDYCPITAVCAVITGKHYHVRDFAIAGEDIGLTKLDVQYLAKAADKVDHPDHQRVLNAVGR